MGNPASKQQCVVPQKGYRVISISRADVAEQLDLLTDYIIFPDPKKIDYRRQSIKFQVYSVLDEQSRTTEISLQNNELGFQLKLANINKAILRITKIFPGSPLQKHKVQVNEFIVGILEGEFSCLKTFAQLIKNTTLLASKSHIAMGICNKQGKTRLIKLQVLDLKQWQNNKQGLLGCELAQGWIHKFKSLRPQQYTYNLKQSSSNRISQSSTLNSPIISQIPIDSGDAEQMVERELDFDLDQEQIDRKCDIINKKYDQNGVLQFKFRGNYKKQQIIDASIVCRCRPVNLQCEKCFVQKQGSYHFFNKKRNRIVCMPMTFMMPLE